MTRTLTAIVTDFPAPSQTFILRKLLGLQAAGYDVRVGAARFGEGASTHGFELERLAPFQQPRDIVTRNGRQAWLASLHGGRRLVSQGERLALKELVMQAPVAAIRSDIVHFEFSGLAVAYRHTIDTLRPAKIVISCRGAAEQIQPLSDPRRAALLRETLPRADLIHCVSDDIRRTVEALGAPAERILVNRPAVPVADFAGLAAQREHRSGPLRVVSVGRLHWKKGLDDGIRAVARACADGTECQYRIGGEGKEREKLTFMIDQLGMSDRIQLLGRQSQEEVRALLGWADVLLLPSLSEGISNAVLEAMAAGLPVIATRSGGMDEVISSGVDGALVEVGDADAMTEWLVTFATDPTLRAKVGAAAAERAVREFDLSRQITNFVTAYERLLST